ncbi:MAG: membrane dipeptidase [Parvularculaceae bacterium]
MTDFSRRTLLAGAAGGLAFAAAAHTEEARGVYARATVIDALGGPGGSKGDSETETEGLTDRHIADARASGLSAVNVTVSDVGNKPDAFENTIDAIAWFENEIDTHPDVFLRIRRGADLKAAKGSGRIGLIYGFQDLTPLNSSLDKIDTFHGLGLRVSQLAYNRRNLAGDGCLEPANGGLSLFGKEAVEKLNASRIVIDGSHGGVRLINEEIALSKAPMAVTHTGCRALNDVPRNIHDATMRALARKGGVMGVFSMPFLKAKGQPHAEDLLRHIEHALRICGEDHVGLGSDGAISGEKIDDPKFQEDHRKFFEERLKLGISAPGEAADVYNVIPEYNDPRRFEKLAFDLSRRKVSDRVIEKVLGGNFARLFAEVWG